MRHKASNGARLGQHFLKHGWAARSLAHAAAIRDGEIFLEIGPGKGILTKELLALLNAPRSGASDEHSAKQNVLVGQVVAIEKDEALVEQLRETFAEDIACGRLRLIEGDVRDAAPENLNLSNYVVAANIPYYITGEIIRQFLTTTIQPRAMALLVQKEVAQRIVSGKESILSLSVKAYGTPRIVEKVSRSHFSPPPSVDSAILAVTDISKKFFDTISEEDFFRVVRAGFASKRKMLINNLSVAYDKEKVRRAFSSCTIGDKVRAEDVPLEKWKNLARNLSTY